MTRVQEYNCSLDQEIWFNGKISKEMIEWKSGKQCVKSSRKRRKNAQVLVCDGNKIQCLCNFIVYF